MADTKPLYLTEEEKVREFWQEAKVFEASVEREALRGDYVFYDGPPFATGLPHYGHIVGQIMKDVVPRFWTMNGFRVERRWGWDCHGLPIENLVEKELGFTNKQQIVEYGIGKFNDVCRSKVMSYVGAWRDMKEKLGRWADMDNDYKTMDLPYMESVWAVFKNLWDKELIYEGYRSMFVCPRCETTLSQSEVSEGYKDIKDLSVVAKFELIDEPGTFVLAWTTTPWTLPGNVALAVNNDIEYVKVYREVDGKGGNYILAKKIFDEGKGNIGYEFSGVRSIGASETPPIVNLLETLKGSDLIGKKYRPLFDSFSFDNALPNHENGWKIYAADFVSAEEGTGIVHIAPAFGEDDLNLGKEKNLPFVQHVGMDGVIKPEVKELAGLHVKPIEDVTSTDVAVIKYLAGKGVLFSKEKYEHSYPHCWRCDTPLINYATSSWFVSVTKIKEKALETAKEINWSPDYIKEGRFGNWLEGARDWSISRQRFWASVMPIWRCDACPHTEVFGSVAELKAASGQEVNDLHKHVVDEVTYSCAKCEGGTMKRVPDVLDTWFDSGSMPYAQMHYPFENKEKFEKNFPAQFIAEGIDQTRTWFYYLHILSAGQFGKPAFKNVIVNGTVVAEDGKKMSKKLQNYPDPMLLMDKVGADALRAYLLSSPVTQAENMNFSEKGVEEALRKNIMMLGNIYSFYALYAEEGTEAGTDSENVLDRWIVASLNRLIESVTKAMQAYDLPKAMRPITDFIDELSTWYIRRSRERFKADDEADKKAALATTKHVLIELSKVMAPFTPFVAEAIWQKVTGNNFATTNKSVHLEMWPKAQSVDESVLSDMETVRKIVEMGLAARDAAKMKIRQPLGKINVLNISLEDQDLVDLIKDELNIKEIIFIKSEGEIKVELDTAITPALEREGLKREIVRLVNNLRKNQGMTIQDRIELLWSSEDEIVQVTMSEYGGDIKNDTLATDVRTEKGEGLEEQKVNGHILSLSIKKI